MCVDLTGSDHGSGWWKTTTGSDMIPLRRLRHAARFGCSVACYYSDATKVTKRQQRVDLLTVRPVLHLL